LNDKVIDCDTAPFAVGLNVTTTVQAAAAFNEVPHVPPVPGKVPPLNVNGADNPDPVIAVEVIDPVFVTVNTLSAVPVVGTAPKS
jgi:hypothetical protein